MKNPETRPRFIWSKGFWILIAIGVVYLILLFLASAFALDHSQVLRECMDTQTGGRRGRIIVCHFTLLSGGWKDWSIFALQTASVFWPVVWLHYLGWRGEKRLAPRRLKDRERRQRKKMEKAAVLAAKNENSEPKG